MSETYSSCPFCGGPATVKEIATDISGVQQPDLTIGCASCNYWLPPEPQETFIKGRGVVAVDAKAKLKAKWENREGK